MMMSVFSAIIRSMRLRSLSLMFVHILHHETLTVPIELGIPVVTAHVNMDGLMFLGEEQENETVLSE